MRPAALKKSRRRLGFTMAETLLAVLIMGIAMGIVVQGIPMTKRVHDKVVDTANAQAVLSAGVTLLRDELSLAGNTELGLLSGDTFTKVTANENGVTQVDAAGGVVAVRYLSGDTGRTSTLYATGENTDTRTKGGLFLRVYVEDAEGKKQESESELVYSVGDSRNKLVFTLGPTGTISYDPAKGLFTITDLQVVRGGDPDTVLAKIETYIIRTVRP